MLGVLLSDSVAVELSFWRVLESKDLRVAKVLDSQSS